MKLQSRDIEIFKFIDKFGYVNSDHIKKMFGLTQPRTSQILSRLEKEDYLKKQRVLAGEFAIYNLRNKAVELLSTSKTKPISLQNLKHNLLVIDVYIDLKLKNSELTIFSDRDLRIGRKLNNKRSIPDLVIETEEHNGKKNIAIEVELSRKEKVRLQKILKQRAREYLETHYYCNGSTYEYISREIKLISNVKAIDYFKYEEIPIDIQKDLESFKKPTGKVIENVSNNKDLEIKATRLENLLKAKDKELDIAKNKVERIKKAFADIEFKKATFGSSYSLSAEELERFNNLLRGI